MSLHKKWNFPLRISPVSLTKSVVSWGFGHIYWRSASWKSSFFVQCVLKKYAKLTGTHLQWRIICLYLVVDVCFSEKFIFYIFDVVAISMPNDTANQCADFYGNLHDESVNPLMNNVPKWSDTLAERFLKCVWPFWDIMH